MGGTGAGAAGTTGAGANAAGTTGTGGSVGGDGGAAGTTGGGTGGGAAGTTGTGGAGGACYGLFQACANAQECCAPYLCISINGGPKCQLEGPMTGGGGAGGTGGGGGAGGAGFCGGDTPRMVVNGVTTTPTVVGQEMILDCCRAARFVVTTSDFSQPIAFDWRWEGPGPLPASISLTNLPDRWRVSLQAGCSVTQPSCLGALDNFTTGFTGQLLVSSFDGGPGFEMNLCLHFTEPAGMPGTILHTLDLYAPHVSTRN